MNDLKGMTALVTGGAVRIGRAICKALAAGGVNIVIHYRNSFHAAEELAEELGGLGVAAYAVAAPDFREPGACAGLIEDAYAAAGTLDILINSAAVFNKDSFFTLDAGKLRNEMEINLDAPILLMQSFAKKCKQGKIVNLVDRRVAGNDTSCIPYLLAKKSLAEMTRLAALSLAPKFTVNAVAPGNALPPSNSGAAKIHDFAQQTPLDADCGPGHVAEAIVFLLKMDCITGQVLYVDSGGHLL